MNPFVPTANTLRALAPMTLVVQGLRGAGKTALVQRLISLSPSDAWGQLASGAPASGAVFFAAANGARHGPEDPAGQRLAWLDGAMRDVHAALPEAPPLPAPGNPSRRVQTGDLLAWLDAAHKTLIARGQSLVLLYDEPTGALGPLLSLWLILSERYRRLRARIFLRPEAMASARLNREEQHKVLMRTVDLVWSAEDLFRMLAAQLPTRAIRFEAHPIFGEVPVNLETGAQCQPIAALAGFESDDEEPVADTLYAALRGRRGQVTPQVFLRTLELTSTPITAQALAIARASAGAEALDALAQEPPFSAIEGLRTLTVPAGAEALAEILGSEALALLQREAVLVPSEDKLDFAALYRPAPI